MAKRAPSSYPSTAMYYHDAFSIKFIFDKDWVQEFETLDICYLPDERSITNHRVIGDFRSGINAPKGNKEGSSKL